MKGTSLKKLYIVAILILMFSTALGMSCPRVVSEKTGLSEEKINQLQHIEHQIEDRLLTLPNAVRFIALNHTSTAKKVIAQMPSVLPNMKHGEHPEVIFVQSLEEFYKLRLENVSYFFSKVSGENASDEAFSFVTQDNAFYDPYANRVVFNVKSFSTFLNIFSLHKEPTLVEYTDALKIFLAHELTHAIQESHFEKIVSKMIESAPEKQLQLSIALEAHAVYSQEVYAKKIYAEGFLLNMHQQAYDFKGGTNPVLREILKFKDKFENLNKFGRVNYLDDIFKSR